MVTHRSRCGCLLFTFVLLFGALPVHAQNAELHGIVRSAATGELLENARVIIEGTDLGALTDEDGRFSIRAVPSGDVVLVVERLGYATARRTVRAGNVAPIEFRLEEEALAVGDIVVTASREAVRRAETAASIGVVGREQLERLTPSHPSEVMNRVPGVWVNVTGGEGHMAAIRQPKTTNPVYLYLENGVPTRSTGFFNHNALYEVNVPQAERIEVVKGPATALYGSDAIGGMVNVLTRDPGEIAPLEVSAEGGAFGFGRVLAAASTQHGSDGLLFEVNATRSSGWRDATGYDRQSGTLRWDRQLGPLSSLRTIATFSRIDQSTAGSSAISREDWELNPERNYTPISYRDVRAFRLSSAYERVGESTLLTLTPFARWNDMEMLPNWSLTYDPSIVETGHASAGFLAKLRRDFEPLRARVIAGVDVDWSPGHHREWAVSPLRDGRIFESFERGERIYDYDVTFYGVSPYVQAEFSPAPNVRVTGGLRYDHLGYDYETSLEPVAAGKHRRPADASVTYDHLSPKLGATLELSSRVNLFAAYGHGFRAPSEGQLFRQGSSVNTVGLKPVRADNLEVGVRTRPAEWLSFELGAYHMTKADDLLSFTRTDGTVETVNAGETLHRGIEAGAAVAPHPSLRFDVAWSWQLHEYEDWVLSDGVSFSGNEIQDGPREVGSASVSFLPALLRGGSVSAELVRVGRYWMDPANTHRYDGHTLLNLRADVPVSSEVTVFARLMNLANERYAENAQYTDFRGEEYAPGMPRALYLGVRYR